MWFLLLIIFSLIAYSHCPINRNFPNRQHYPIPASQHLNHAKVDQNKKHFSPKYQYYDVNQHESLIFDIDDIVSVDLELLIFIYQIYLNYL